MRLSSENTNQTNVDYQSAQETHEVLEDSAVEDESPHSEEVETDSEDKDGDDQ